MAFSVAVTRPPRPAVATDRPLLPVVVVDVATTLVALAFAASAVTAKYADTPVSKVGPIDGTLPSEEVIFDRETVTVDVTLALVVPFATVGTPAGTPMARHDDATPLPKVLVVDEPFPVVTATAMWAMATSGAAPVVVTFDVTATLVTALATMPRPAVLLGLHAFASGHFTKRGIPVSSSVLLLN